ncbi:unnamed protein product (macronuclear) [Paramecium tetraurelia]|uniref:B box-type domain-containing protein n=1 Tax=Paramecium tetraurelia TaxID=5888 RepID=A0D5S4_PARTE|nr:uncharacterized protein GSPATT00013821001 [Paramecium tetraurelia]CAK78391.1 unnamed protein product [Paramecium tetraurelia]|eukprot:XP_001445788.1 hypothetical protein (macronuclear) [Paramecium tetraurelia strain d4-2]
MEEKCKLHQKDITHIDSCIHPDCFKYKRLCPDCIVNHESRHKKNQIYQNSQFTITIQECKQQVEKNLNTVKEELELAENRAANALITSVNSNIDEIILEIESIRQQIHKLFDKYIQGLRDKFEYKVKQSIHALYDIIQGQLTQIRQFQNDINSIDTQKKVMSTDLDYQVQYQKNRLESLIYQRANQKFYGRIDDDVALHFIGVIQKELEQLVIYEKNKLSSQIESLNQMTIKAQQTKQKSIKNFQKFLSYAPEKLDEMKNTMQGPQEYSFYRSWLHYFEPGTKFLYYLDLKQQNPQITKIELEINFLITQGSRSILASDGQIYYFSGYDNGFNEDENKTIYQYDHPQLTFIKKSRMYTLRKNFSLSCTVDKDIFIIGGQNYKEGCLAKCEKYNINTNQITLINHLTELSTLHSSCTYNNKLIVKFGGLIANTEGEDLKKQCSGLLELYFIEQDCWERVENTTNHTQYPLHTILSTSIQILNSNMIYIFGGQILQKQSFQTVNQGFMIQIEEEEEFDQDQIKFQPKLYYQLQHPIPQQAHFLTQPIYYSNKIMCLLKDGQIIRSCYEKNKWKSF